MTFLAVALHSSREQAKLDESSRRLVANTRADFVRPAQAAFATSGRLLVGPELGPPTKKKRQRRSQAYRLRVRLERLQQPFEPPDDSLFNLVRKKAQQSDQAHARYLVSVAKMTAVLKRPLAAVRSHFATLRSMTPETIDPMAPRNLWLLLKLAGTKGRELKPTQWEEAWKKRNQTRDFA